MRATTSTPEPAGKPIRMVIGCAGQLWASASDGNKTSRRKRSMRLLSTALEPCLSPRAPRHRFDGAGGEHLHLPRYDVQVPRAALSGAGHRVRALHRADAADDCGA